MVDSLYFRVIGRPDPALFDGRWIEIPASPERFHLNRSVWFGAHVSRRDDECAVIGFDPHDDVWRMENRARGRIVILDDGRNRYDLQTNMAVVIGPGRWTGTLTGAFSFEITHARPAGTLRLHGVSAAPYADDGTEPWDPVVRAREYLGRHRLKRLALAYLWRDHLTHTVGVAADRSSTEVGHAFGEQGSTITGWREDLAAHVYGERGHQKEIRDFVVKHALLDGGDVDDADGHLGGGRPRGGA